MLSNTEKFWIYFTIWIFCWRNYLFPCLLRPLPSSLSVPSFDLPKPTFHWLHCSTLGQGLQTSTYPGEVIFSIALAIFGLILFALLIGNMQVYFKSMSLTYHESKIAGSLIIQFVQNLQEFPWACIWLGQIYWILEWLNNDLMLIFILINNILISKWLNFTIICVVWVGLKTIK